MSDMLLEQAIIEYRIKHILKTPHLKAKYLAEYKRETGSNVLDEGFIDSLRDKFSSAATKVKNVAKGVADIGFLGRGTTIFGGSETFDIEKRKKMLDVATASLEMELKAISKWPETKDYGVELTKLYEYLKNTKFPNSDSFKTDVAMIKKKYDNIIENFNNNKTESLADGLKLRPDILLITCVIPSPFFTRALDIVSDICSGVASPISLKRSNTSWKYCESAPIPNAANEAPASINPAGSLAE